MTIESSIIGYTAVTGGSGLSPLMQAAGGQGHISAVAVSPTIFKTETEGHYFYFLRKTESGFDRIESDTGVIT